VFILTTAGLGGGLIAGLVGVGGGIVFAPVLFFFFQATGVPANIVAPMTIGTSLLCTLLASSMSAYQHHNKQSVVWPVALRVGATSTVALYVVVAFVTTESWYDRDAFQLVFGLVLAVVAIRMIFNRAQGQTNTDVASNGRAYSALSVSGIGSAAGFVAGLAGVGGGIVMVPAYHGVLRLSMRESIGTSSGAIVLISLAGVAGYVIAGWTTVSVPGAIGYVDATNGVLLALPGLLGARLGAHLAHRIPRTLLRIAFATLALGVALRLLYTGVATLLT
jgi:uncharacterized membrane protein YfcA